MNILKDTHYTSQLISILRFIAKDKVSAAIKFEKELEHEIQGLIDFPLKYRASVYFEDTSYRDLVYQGYTIIYKVQADAIWILEIFKWVER
ncbi:MAG: type II toxin-antitoxin system RelE/ParE family toxin [Campylobacteraceae bacterium]|nr:type II toxin-antitoxin system RelE/ParE family toxin [Campylobacteraceae bacterium]